GFPARAALRCAPPTSHPITLRMCRSVPCRDTFIAPSRSFLKVGCFLKADRAVEIIPVVDLKGGAVVRARMGRRAEYRPIETPLAATSDPVNVARGLLSVHAFA